MPLAPDSPVPWFIGGPPLGEGVFDAVIDRLGRGRAVPLLDEATPDHGWTERGDVLAAAARAAGHPVVLVAHGLALPVALRAAPAFAAVVLLNGPVTRLDPVTRLLARAGATAPALLAGTLLRPEVLAPWLASSVGLRRLVSNPYVMDRDTVAALAVSRVSTAGLRRATAAYLASLGASLPDVHPLDRPTLVLWGDSDLLYPSYEADFLSVRAAAGAFRRIPGGRHLVVVERPWEVADRLDAFLAETFPAAPVATSVSGSGAARASTGRGRSKK